MPNFNFFGAFLRKIKKFFRFFKIDFSFVLIFVLAFFLDEIYLYFCFVIFICLHELSHFLIAKKLGYLASKIHLTFFGASLEGLDDFLLEDEIKIILAGPLFNLAMVIFCYLSFWFYPESYHFLSDVLTANLAIFLFNFLPIYPLDFGRIILASLSKHGQRQEALGLTKTISLIFVFALFLVFLLSFFFDFNFSLGFVCVNLASLVLRSSKDTSYKRSIFVRRKFKLLKKGLIERNVYVSNSEPIFKLFKFIDDYHFFNFIFLDEDLKEVGKKSEIEIYHETGML